MKNSVMLTISSLLLVLFHTFHLANDIVRDHRNRPLLLVRLNEP